MSSNGFIYWNDRHLKEEVYLDGKEWLVQEQPDRIRVIPVKDSETSAILTAAGTHVLWKPFYYGEVVRSALQTFFEFQLTLLALDEEEFNGLRRAQARGRAVYFVPYCWVEEVFTNVTTSQQLTLTRPVAWGISPSANSGIHPAHFVLDGVEDPGAASLTGQVVTAADTGDELVVRYLPAFRVLVELGESYEETNRLMADLMLREVVQVG